MELRQLRQIDIIVKDIEIGLNALLDIKNSSDKRQRQLYLYNIKTEEKQEIISWYKEGLNYYLKVEDIRFSNRIIDLSTINLELYKLKFSYYDYGTITRTREFPKELKKTIPEYQLYMEHLKNLTIETKLQEELEDIEIIPFDEEGRKVSIGEWLEAAKVADEPRSPYDSRAVVVNNTKLFINAYAAIGDSYLYQDYLDQRRATRHSDPRKDGAQFYDSCEKNGKFRGMYVRYATKEEIFEKVKALEN